jgi:tRNA A-37 threonylcarbamoyl transferase component Bud32
VPERYEGLEILGQGAMGVVYKAHDRDLDRTVAIKTIHPASVARGDFEAIAARLCREAMAAARLAHPGIVAVYDVGRVSETPYIVMEYFTGRTLAEILEAGPLSPARAVQVMLQVCRALEYAHTQGVVHRDIKTSNIMVDARWNAKLTDFGVARILDKPTSETKMVIGTPAYMAPEQARGAPGDARSDLFAVGVVLYETLTGVKAFPGDDVATVLDEVLHVDPVPPRERNFAVSPALDAVVRRAIDKEPDDRYRDAAAFAEALMQASAIDGAPTGVGTLASYVRGRTLVLAAAAILVAIVVGIFTSPLVERVIAIREEPRKSPPAGALTPSAATGASAPAVVDAQQPSAKRGCVSVNAVPFAKVYVDGRPVGETPQACVRVRHGQHSVQFQWGSEHSPEYLITVGKEHTAENPLRASYDFKAGRFVSSTE